MRSTPLVTFQQVFSGLKNTYIWRGICPWIGNCNSWLLMMSENTVYRSSEILINIRLEETLFLYTSFEIQWYFILSKINVTISFISTVKSSSHLFSYLTTPLRLSQLILFVFQDRRSNKIHFCRILFAIWRS